MEEANYDDDDDEEGERTKDTENENENDGNGENDKGDNAPAEKAQPKQGAKKRRRGGRNARSNKAKQKEKDPDQVQEEKKQVGDTIGRSILTAKMKKTRMCDFHKEGRCKYGEDCAFAHDEQELQSAPDLRKTRLCRSFLAGKCDDRDCKFAHGEDELRASDICFKTALCTWFEKGTCQSGSQCRFAHGEDELRCGTIPKPRQQRSEPGSECLIAVATGALKGLVPPWHSRSRCATAVAQQLQLLWATEFALSVVAERRC